MVQQVKALSSMPGILTKVERICSTKLPSALHSHAPSPYHTLPPTHTHNNKKINVKKIFLSKSRSPPDSFPLGGFSWKKVSK